MHQKHCPLQLLPDGWAPSCWREGRGTILVQCFHTEIQLMAFQWFQISIRVRDSILTKQIEKTQLKWLVISFSWGWRRSNILWFFGTNAFDVIPRSLNILIKLLPCMCIKLTALRGSLLCVFVSDHLAKITITLERARPPRRESNFASTLRLVVGSKEDWNRGELRINA